MAATVRERRDHMVAEGLLFPAELGYVPGRRGRRAIWPEDTTERERIIRYVRRRLGSRFEYRYAANELLLLGYDLYGQVGADLTRLFLVTFRRAWALAEQALHYRQEDQDGNEKSLVEQRAYWSRHVATLAKHGGVPRSQDHEELDVYDVLRYMLLSQQGIAPHTVHHMTMPDLPRQDFTEQAEQLADRDRIPDHRIAWAIAEARTYAGRVGPRLAAQLVSLTGIPEPELVRVSFTGHIYCTTRHTLAQAMLPHLAAMLALDPDGTAAMRDNSLPLLHQAFRDLGGLTAGLLGS